MKDERKAVGIAWAAAGLKTVGEVREVSEDTLLSFQDFGLKSLATVRESLVCRRQTVSGRYKMTGNRSKGTAYPLPQ
jgi:DNA-directed RNA polymerase alpha subunit